MGSYEAWVVSGLRFSDAADPNGSQTALAAASAQPLKRVHVCGHCGTPGRRAL